MKKIKLLYRFLILINILTLILIGVQTFGLVIPDLLGSRVSSISVLGRYNNLLLTTLLVIILAGSFKIQQGVKYMIKEGFFNPTSEIKFRMAGTIFIVFAICRIIYIAVAMKDFKLNELINNSILAFLVILVGLGLLIFSDFIKNGGILKQENDLTI
ncbi:hypothetical protein [Pontimicrobium sp. IMCC45349]|uniref:hypothetical protein n=1 Tax=Pontimicrobium sp. IMCC45349 TaxID=3391574 RepID=UPI00399F63FA